MAVIKCNFFNLFVIVLLLAAYTSEVRTKPTESENGIASDDVGRTTKPTPKQASFFMELDPEASSPVQKAEESKKLKPTQNKKIEGSTEKSKSKTDSSEEKKPKKNKPVETSEANYDEMHSRGWDLSVLDKDDNDYSEESAAKAVDSANTKDKQATPSKKSKASKSELTTESDLESEPLPRAQGQKSHPTTLRPTTTEPSTGSATTNLPRALCSFVVVVATVLLVM